MDIVYLVMVNGLSIIGTTLATVYFYFLTRYFVEIKARKYHQVTAFVTLWFVVSIIIFVNDLVNVGYGLVAFIVVMLICYEGSTVKKISVVMILYPMVVAVNYITHGLYYVIPNFSYEEWVFVIALFWYGVYWVVKKKIRYVSKHISDKTWVLIDVVCFAPFLAVILTIIWTGHHEQYKAYTIATISICSNIGILFLIKYMVESMRIRQANETYQLQYDYYKSLEDEQLRTRKIYHDMNNNLQVIHSYMEDGKVHEAKGYFDKLFQVTHTYKSKNFCKNSIVNAVLNNKYTIINNHEIDCHMHIDIDNMIAIDDMDLCSILSNTLDNAIEASVLIGEPAQRKIIIRARTNKDFFSYSVSNNKTNNVLKNGDSIISSKQDKKRHGYGLQNVRHIVDKYRGTLEINYDDKNFSVILIIRK